MKDQVLSQAEIDALFSQMGQSPAQPGQTGAAQPAVAAAQPAVAAPQPAAAAPQPPAAAVQPPTQDVAPAAGPEKAAFPSLTPTTNATIGVPAPSRSAGFHTGEPSLPIALLSDVELEVTVQLGQTTRSIREILEMSPGAVLELDRLAGDSVDILVNGRLVAKAEVVVIGDNFGVRITELIKPEGGNS